MRRTVTNLSSVDMNSQEAEVIYQLILFVAGNEPNSNLARQNLQEFCQTELKGQYQLQVVDVFQDHKLALQHRVLVTPCLIMTSPPPLVMIAGTLRDKEKVRFALRIPKE